MAGSDAGLGNWEFPYSVGATKKTKTKQQKKQPLEEDFVGKILRILTSSG